MRGPSFSLDFKRVYHYERFYPKLSNYYYRQLHCDCLRLFGSRFKQPPKTFVSEVITEAFLHFYKTLNKKVSEANSFPNKILVHRSCVKQRNVYVCWLSFVFLLQSPNYRHIGSSNTNNLSTYYVNNLEPESILVSGWVFDARDTALTIASEIAIIPPTSPRGQEIISARELLRSMSITVGRTHKST